MLALHSSSTGRAAVLSPSREAMKTKTTPTPSIRRRSTTIITSASAEPQDFDYASPRPYSSPQAGEDLTPYFGKVHAHDAKPANTIHAWSYRSPRNYQTPRTYRSPRAEDARVTYGGGDSGPGSNNGGGNWGGGRGGRGGGGGGGRGGRGGRGFGGEPWSLVTVAAAALVAAGGGMAYKKKGSRASLEAGAALGGVLLAAASLQTGAATQGAGLILALLCSSALAAYMGKGFARSKKAWPHGALAGFGLLLSGGYVAALSELQA